MNPTSAAIGVVPRRKPRSKVVSCKDLLWSVILFSIGFYIRGLVDFYSLLEHHNQDDEAIFLGLGISSQQNNEDHVSNVQIVNQLIHHQQQQQQHQQSDSRTHWCVIAAKFIPKTTAQHFDHFPHTSEVILPCWSYFVEQGVTDRCGFAFANERFHPLPSWIQEIVDAMGCQVKFSNKGLGKNPIADFLPKDDIQYIPNLYLLRPRLDYIRYVNNPEHAHMIRRFFVDDNYISEVKGKGKPLQIGMIQREGARRIDNIDKIFKWLKKDIPEGNITITDFKFKTVKEQATWFATQDMVIASHGAALINSLFITPGTIVMQMYPPGYFLQTLEPLIEQCGGVAVQWFKKGVNPYVESHELNVKNHTLFEELGQSGGFSPEPIEVVDRVKSALGVKRTTVSLMLKMFGHYV